jgi:hypothetical protein
VGRCRTFGIERGAAVPVNGFVALWPVLRTAGRERAESEPSNTKTSISRRTAPRPRAAKSKGVLLLLQWQVDAPPTLADAGIDKKLSAPVCIPHPLGGSLPASCAIFLRHLQRYRTSSSSRQDFVEGRETYHSL